MKQTQQHEGNPEIKSLKVITPFLRWFLLKETLVKDEVVAKLLEDMDQGLVTDQERWAESIRRALLPHVVQVLGGILERPIKPDEMRFIIGKVEEFISIYGGGFSPQDNFQQN